MTEKTTIRALDRDKLKKYYQTVLDHFKREFNSEPYCNRCKQIFLLENLEIHHVTYETDSYRFGELVCRSCHVAIENNKLPSFEEVKRDAPKTILVFQKHLPGLAILSKLESGRIIQSGHLKFRPNETLNPLVLIGVFSN